MVSSLRIGTGVPERFDPRLWPFIRRKRVMSKMATTNRLWLNTRGCTSQISGYVHKVFEEEDADSSKRGYRSKHRNSIPPLGPRTRLRRLRDHNST